MQITYNNQYTTPFSLMPNPSIHAHRYDTARKSPVLSRRELQKAVMEILG